MFSAGYTFISGDNRTKAVKEAWAEAEKSGKIVLTMEEFDAINGMCAALWSSKNAEVFLRPALSEYSVFTELNGVRVKCRPDAWNVGYNVILDLKTTEDAGPRAFAASCRKWRYYVQDAYYRHVVAAAIGVDADSDLSFVFVAVEKKPPFGVAWYTLDGNDAALGWAEALGDMQIYKNAMESGNWPGYSAKIETLSIFSRRADV